MTRRRFDLTLTPEIGSAVDRVIEEERALDVERFMPPRAVTAILESLIRQGLELRRARQKLQSSQDVPRSPLSSEKHQEQTSRTDKR